MLIDIELFSRGVIATTDKSTCVITNYKTAFTGEIFECADTSTTETIFGLVVSVTNNNNKYLVGGLLMNAPITFSAGILVQGTYSLATLTLGSFAASSMIRPTGELVLSGSSNITPELKWIIDTPAPSITSRKSVCEPLLTGLVAVDAMIPIGRGQRELIIGDRQTGKTSIILDTIINLKSEKVLSVYVPVGQKAAIVLSFYQQLIKRNAFSALTIMLSTASSSSVLQYLSVYAGTAIGEFFMYTYSVPVFISYDDLAKQAASYREISLLLRRPPGREAFPGDIFYVHSRLLERSAKLNFNCGSGSITAFPLVETLAQDVSAYIPTNLISITDGQLFLSTDLFNQGIKPAIDVGISVTRVGSAAQLDQMKMVAGRLKLDLAQFVELEAFSQFASDLGEDTLRALAQGRVLRQLLKQDVGSPISLSQQCFLLSLGSSSTIAQLATTNGLVTVSKLINIFLTIPDWVYLYVSPLQIATSLSNIVKNND